MTPSLIPFALLLTVMPLVAADTTIPGPDGWSGGEVQFTLSQGTPVAPLVVRGLVPGLGDTPFTPELTVQVDGQDLIKQIVGPGDFEIRAISTAAAGKHQVVVRFSEVRALPAPDGRKIGGRLTQVGFEALQAAPATWRASGEAADLVPAGGSIGLGSGWLPFETFQGESFRWIGAEAQLAVIPGQEMAITLTAEPGPSLAGRPCELRVTDRAGHLIDKLYIPRKGSYDLILPALAAESQPIRFSVAGPLIPVPGDGRMLGLRVLAITPRP